MADIAPGRDAPHLARSIGLWSAVAVVIGSTIGSGIFRSPAGIADKLPGPLPMLAVWAAGGVFALCGALTLAEVASALPETGGLYVFCRDGWGQFSMIRAASLGAIAITFAEYFFRVTGQDPQAPGKVMAVRWFAAFAIATALYDAIGLAAKELRNKSGRKFIIVLTDGFENASQNYTSKESAADEVNKSGVAAYIIGLGYDVDTPSLDFIGSATNGMFLASPTTAQLATQFNHILKLMQNLVVVSYRSRENKSIGEISVYLNYGSITGSAKRKYGG